MVLIRHLTIPTVIGKHNTSKRWRRLGHCEVSLKQDEVIGPSITFLQLGWQPDRTAALSHSLSFPFFPRHSKSTYNVSHKSWGSNVLLYSYIYVNVHVCVAVRMYYAITVVKRLYARSCALHLSHFAGFCVCVSHTHTHIHANSFCTVMIITVGEFRACTCVCVSV